MPLGLATGNAPKSFDKPVMALAKLPFRNRPFIHHDEHWLDWLRWGRVRTGSFREGCCGKRVIPMSAPLQ